MILNGKRILLISFFVSIFVYYASKTACADMNTPLSDIIRQEVLNKVIQDLQTNDVILVVIPYKYIFTGNKKIGFARVVQSLRGKIPVESLIRWYERSDRDLKTDQAEIILDRSMRLMFLCIKSKDIVRLSNNEAEIFAPATGVFHRGDVVYSEVRGYATCEPMTGSEYGKCIQTLLKIRQAHVVAQDPRAAYQPNAPSQNVRQPRSLW